MGVCACECIRDLQNKFWRTELFQSSNKVTDQLVIHLHFQSRPRSMEVSNKCIYMWKERVEKIIFLNLKTSIHYGWVHRWTVLSLFHGFLVCPSFWSRIKLEVAATNFEGVAESLRVVCSQGKEDAVHCSSLVLVQECHHLTDPCNELPVWNILRLWGGTRCKWEVCKIGAEEVSYNHQLTVLTVYIYICTSIVLTVDHKIVVLKIKIHTWATVWNCQVKKYI